MASRPAQVEQARLRRDTPALSRMGSAGARATNLKKDLIQASDSALKEKKRVALEQELYARAVEANEHITPIDPDAVM